MIATKRFGLCPLRVARTSTHTWPPPPPPPDAPLRAPIVPKPKPCRPSRNRRILPRSRTQVGPMRHLCMCKSMYKWVWQYQSQRNAMLSETCRLRELYCDILWSVTPPPRPPALFERSTAVRTHEPLASKHPNGAPLWGTCYFAAVGCPHSRLSPREGLS